MSLHSQRLALVLDYNLPKGIGDGRGPSGSVHLAVVGDSNPDHRFPISGTNALTVIKRARLPWGLNPERHQCHE